MNEPVSTFVLVPGAGGFSAPMACGRRPVERLVLLDAMIPLRGETPGTWWDATGATAARVQAAEAGVYAGEFDPETSFLHDVPAETVASGAAHVRDEAALAFGQPCAMERWPDVPTVVLASRDDRVFPLDFQRPVARARLGRDVEVVPGGHLATWPRWRIRSRSRRRSCSPPAPRPDRVLTAPAAPPRPRRPLRAEDHLYGVRAVPVDRRLDGLAVGLEPELVRHHHVVG
jgi:hypothetical protein